ncbi:MAG: hypothetical protein N4A38_00570 [Candidatus Gracilibacteria bacterium]|nr:hypothetical protein [Candidatus Gracilibacteria bacterium]
MFERVIDYMKENFPYINDSKKTFQKVSIQTSGQIKTKAEEEKQIEITNDFLNSIKYGSDEKIINILLTLKDVDVVGKIDDFIEILVEKNGINFVFDFIENFSPNVLKVILKHINNEDINELSYFLIKVDKNSFQEIFIHIFSEYKNKKEFIVSILLGEILDKKQKINIIEIILFQTKKMAGINIEYITLQFGMELLNMDDIIVLFIKNNPEDNNGIFFSYFYFLYNKDMRTECLSHFLSVIKSKDNNFYKTKNTLNGLKKLIETDDLDMSYMYEIDPELLLEYCGLLSTNPTKNQLDGEEISYNKYIQ